MKSTIALFIMYQRILIILVLLFINIPSSFSQKHKYAEGYLITSKNDTIRGDLADRKITPYRTKLYKKIRLKTDYFIPKKYNVYQVKKYCIEGQCYESIWLEQDRILFKEINIIQAQRGRKQFYKIVIEGYLTHYQLEFSSGNNDLNYIDYFKRKDDDYMVRVTQGIFGLKKKRLAEYFKDCPELVQKIEFKELKRPFEIAQFYNNCRGDK